jgi:hypothetical protein
VELDIFGVNFGTVLPMLTIEGVQQAAAAGSSDTFVKGVNPILSVPLSGVYRMTLTNNSQGGIVNGGTTWASCTAVTALPLSPCSTCVLMRPTALRT